MSQSPSPVGASGALDTTQSTPAGSSSSIQMSSSILPSPVTVNPQTEHWVPTTNVVPVAAEQLFFPSSDLNPVGAITEHDAGLIGLAGTEGAGDWWLS
jgi:hypothetical protein